MAASQDTFVMHDIAASEIDWELLSCERNGSARNSEADWEMVSNGSFRKDDSITWQICEDCDSKSDISYVSLKSIGAMSMPSESGSDRVSSCMMAVSDGRTPSLDPSEIDSPAIPCKIISLTTPKPRLPGLSPSFQMAVQQHETCKIMPLTTPKPIPGVSSFYEMAVYQHEVKRQLWDTLWYSQPHWCPHYLAQAEHALAQIGVCSLQDLVKALSEDLRKALMMNNQTLPFGAVGSLRRYLRVKRGGGFLPPRPTSEPDSITVTPERELCNFLWERRPRWTPRKFLSSKRKLLRMNVKTLSDLSDMIHAGGASRLEDCLDHGVSDGLRGAGYRPAIPQIDKLATEIDAITSRR